jgi:peroxiredoxin
VKKNSKTQMVILGVLISGAVLVFLLLRQGENPAVSGQPTVVSVDRPAPDFSLPLLDGRKTRLSDYTGQVVLLNIWATWCPPCLSEMPSMEKLYQKFKDEDFQILAVSIDTMGADVVAPFIKNHNLSFPVLIDSKGTITRLYRTTGVPESFIINKNGVVVQKIVGPIDWTEPSVLEYFQGLIQEPLQGKTALPGK